jgi:hypothetical protein
MGVVQAPFFRAVERGFSIHLFLASRISLLASIRPQRIIPWGRTDGGPGEKGGDPVPTVAEAGRGMFGRKDD